MATVNEARELPQSVGVMIGQTGVGQICPTPNTENLPCVDWHLGGYRSSVPDETDLMRLIKEKLPRVDFPVSVGSTGYIIWPSKDVLPTCGYTLDEVGRTVGVVDEIRFFQRYTRNCMLVAHMGRENDYFTTLTRDDEVTLMDRLNDQWKIKGSEE